MVNNTNTNNTHTNFSAHAYITTNCENAKFDLQQVHTV